MIIQAALLALVILYYKVAAARDALVALAHWKQAFGFAFSFLAGALAGGVLPEMFKIVLFQKGRITAQNRSNFIFGCLYWGGQGMLVDAFYRGQELLFGSGSDVATVVKKVLCDQFAFTPFLATPMNVGVLAWKSDSYRWRGMGRLLTPAFFKAQIVPVLMAAWGVWIPVVALVYSLPSLLQIPFFSLALTFWVLLITWMTERKE